MPQRVSDERLAAIDADQHTYTRGHLATVVADLVDDLRDARATLAVAAPQEPDDDFDYDEAARQFFRDTVTEHENYYATHWTDETAERLADAMRKVAHGEMPDVTLYVQREQEPDAVAAAKERVVGVLAAWRDGRGFLADVIEAADALRAAEQAAGRREDDDVR